MMILTKPIKEKLIANHKHHKEYWNDEHPKYKEFKAVLKLFNPTGIGTWYLSELDPEKIFGNEPYVQIIIVVVIALSIILS